MNRFQRHYFSGHSVLRKGRVSTPRQIYLVTATTHKRQPFFADFLSACAAARCFEDKKILRDSSLLCWVLMPDHAHWLIELGDNDTLSQLMNRLKSASGRHANQVRDNVGALWGSAYHDRVLRREDDAYKTACYVINNPLRAGLVSGLGDYPFWNAAWL